MDNLKEIIQHFSREEALEFGAFINRLKHKKGRKDLELFTLLFESQDGDIANFMNKIYPEGNMEAYHALRKKLLKHLVDFIYFKQLKEDYTEETQVSGLISLSRYLLDRKSYHLAMKFLFKAEQLAKTSEQFALANKIIGLQLEMPLVQLDINVDELLKRKSNYKKLAEEDDNANTAYNLIRYKLELAKRAIVPIDFHVVASEVIDGFKLRDTIISRPSVLYRLMSILRSAVIAEKDYFSFEPILVEHFNAIESRGGFSKKEQYYRASLLYMLTHTLLEIKKMDEAMVFLEELEISMKELNKTQYLQLFPKGQLLGCAVLFFSGKINEASERIDQLWDKDLKLEPARQLDVILNESIYKFYNNDYKGANRALLKIGHSDNWCIKIAGVEWTLKKSIIEVLIQFELGHSDIASNRLRSIFKKDQLFKKHPRYERAMVYLHLVNELIENPGIELELPFQNKVEQSFRWIPIEEEDLHASVFYAWLKARMLQEPHYEVLLDLLKRW